MTTRDLNQVRELDQICEIAARLSEDAAVLRTLGMPDIAHLLEGVEADLDSRVYANGYTRNGGGPISVAKPARGRRAKPRGVRTH